MYIYIRMVMLISILLVAMAPLAAATLTQTEKETILNMHNDFREDANPLPKTMDKLSWNADLSSAAQTWTERCKREVGWPENLKTVTIGAESIGNNPIGVNMYMGKASLVEIKSTLNEWNEENKHYNFCEKTCSDYCKNYTQIVRVDTKWIGCGKTDCVPGDRSIDTKTLIVCYYYPKGDERESPYKTLNDNECNPPLAAQFSYHSQSGDIIKPVVAGSGRISLAPSGILLCLFARSVVYGLAAWRA